MAQSDRREISQFNLGMVFGAQEKDEYEEESTASKEDCTVMR